MMNRTALVYNEDYLKHYAGECHPERRERLSATMDYFRETGILEKVMLLKPEACSEEDILRVHTREYLDRLKKLADSGGGSIDADTYCGPETLEVAKLACGGCVLAGKIVMEEQVDNAFALIRPPGHHASRDKAAGFCFLNNAAIMIRYLQEVHSLERIFLFDWDAHAGHGTIDIFYDDPSVLNVSMHQDPKVFYPGSGFMEECGLGKGAGYTVNIPLPPGTGDADYLHIMHEFVIPLVRKYKPQFMVISAGQDSHMEDDISGLSLTENGYGKMTRILVEEAGRLCNGRIVAETEGGYHLESFARSNHAIISSLLGVDRRYDIKGHVRGSTDLVLKRLRDLLLDSL